jgi:hypothetical protein
MHTLIGVRVEVGESRIYQASAYPDRGVDRWQRRADDGANSAIQRCAIMNPSDQPGPTPAIDAIEARLFSLLRLRMQMLELHARLEYLRLMLRLNRPLG